MTTGVSHQRVCDWYEAWNRNDWDAISDFLSEQVELDDVALGRTIHGRSEYLRYAKAWREAFPSGKITVRRIGGAAREGETMVVEYVASGRQEGHWGVFEPTGRNTTMRFCDLLRFEHDKLSQVTTYTDLYRPLSELGHVVSAKRLISPEAA